MNEQEDSAIQVRLGAKIARNNIVFWIMELQQRHDNARAQMEHEDDYQLGYLHGLTSAITFLDERLDDIYKHDDAMRDYLKELRDDQQR